MRVLLILPCFTYGGAEKQASILARHLKSSGNYVEVWGFPSLGSESPLREEFVKEGIQCKELSAWPTLDWNFDDRGFFGYYKSRFFIWPKQVKKVSELLPTGTYDVVVPFTPIPSLVAALFAEKIGGRKILWNHRGGYDNGGLIYTKFLTRIINKKNPIMMANSAAGVKFISDTFGVAQGKVSLIPNVFLPDFSISEWHIESKYHYNNVNKSIELLHVANLFSEKDIWTVLKAMELLKNRKYSCHLHVAGFFPEINDYNKFHELIAGYGLTDMVTYNGAVNRTNLHELLLKADIGILSSRSEGVPNSVMEYMYAGLPVIGTNIPGIRELLGEAMASKTLFDLQNAEQLAARIVSLGSDHVMRKSIGIENRYRVLHCFSVEKVMPIWEKFLTSLL